MIALNHLNSTQKSTFQKEAATLKTKAAKLSICSWLSSYILAYFTLDMYSRGHTMP